MFTVRSPIFEKKIGIATLRELLQIFTVFSISRDSRHLGLDQIEHENTFGEAGRQF